MGGVVCVGLGVGVAWVVGVRGDERVAGVKRWARGGWCGACGVCGSCGVCGVCGWCGACGVSGGCGKCVDI